MIRAVHVFLMPMYRYLSVQISKYCMFWLMVVTILQVSASYSRTVLKLVFSILNLMLPEGCLEFHMFSNCRNAVFALQILALMYALDPPRSSIVLSRYVKL